MSEALVAELRLALKTWDEAYLEVWHDMEAEGLKVTEERLKVGTRNELRLRGVELPEVVRWKLRFALGTRSQEEE